LVVKAPVRGFVFGLGLVMREGVFWGDFERVRRDIGPFALERACRMLRRAWRCGCVGMVGLVSKEKCVVLMFV
jgi:hypothetical protein